MDKKWIRVCLQLGETSLHPLAQNVVHTARALAEEKNYDTQGVLFTEKFSDSVRESLLGCGLTEVLIFEGEAFKGFQPEIQTDLIKDLFPAEICLFPSTPEGRALSSMLGARLHTGVTADCTALSFLEDGQLLQVRPAFSNSRLAEIVTRGSPQIASLRFAKPVSAPKGKTRLLLKPVDREERYPVSWGERSAAGQQKVPLALVLGGGIRRKEDLAEFKSLAESLGAELYCSRALVNRGWMNRDRQIGLSGSLVSAQVMITLGVSGSLQFQAGLGQIDHLCVVDTNENTALMRLADSPIKADLYEIKQALLST